MNVKPHRTAKPGAVFLFKSPSPKKNVNAGTCLDYVKPMPIDGRALIQKDNDQFMMIRNYAKQTCGLFTRTAANIGAMSVLQYVNFCNHRPPGQVKYALI